MWSWIALFLVALSGLFLVAVLYVYGWFGRRPSTEPSFALPIAGDETEIDRQLGPLLGAARADDSMATTPISSSVTI